MTTIDPLDSHRQRAIQIEKLAAELKELESSRKKTQQAIHDYRSFAPGSKKRKIDRLKTSAEVLSGRITVTEAHKAKYERRLRTVKAAQTNPVIVWQYFSRQQKQLRTEVRNLEQALFLAEQRLSDDQARLSGVYVDTETARKSLFDHESFDLLDAEKLLSSLGKKIEQKNADHDAAIDEYMRIDSQIQPHTRELNRLQLQLITLNDDISQAKCFEQDLTSASNSYERAKIHSACSETFEFGSPKKVIEERRRKIRSLENDIAKVQRRIRDTLRKLENSISRILIDGNNLCYEGQTFIGIRAISALLVKLDGQYETTVVFDPSIRAMLATNNQDIERVLGATANIYIAPTRTTADEYLMKLAGKDSNTFILSNDRFAEYHDYEVVKAGRLLRFLIANGKLMLSDIDIAVDF